MIFDDWGEPVKYGPSEWMFEVAVLGDVRVRVSHWRGKLAGVEWWTSPATENQAYGYNIWRDPGAPWLKRGEASEG